MGTLIPLSFAACLFAHASFCLVQESIPEGGSTLAGDEGEENITIVCTLLREAGGPQQVTEWFILRPGQSTPQLILDNQGFANFEIVGEPIPNTTNRDFRTNITILRLTSNLDRAVISCGLGGINIILAANFTLRIYKPPSLRGIPPMTVVEGGGVITINLDLDPEAFPFPQFQWTMNGQVATNNTPRVTYSYPGVTFTSYDRLDSGIYNLTATNYRLDNTSVVVGMDTGSFSLDVQFPAQIEVPGDTHVILEGGDITLVCGTSAIGNPTPTISWTDNNGTTVSDGSGISGSDTLMLTIMDVTRNHTGNWTCSVENSVRDAERRIVLVVVVAAPPTTMPSEPPQRQQDNSAAIAGGVVGGIVAVVLICLIVLLIVYLVLRHRGQKLGEVSIGGIITTGESTRQHDTEHISTKQCSAYGIALGTDTDDVEYELLEFEHISTQQYGAYGVVPETDADNIYEN